MVGTVRKAERLKMAKECLLYTRFTELSQEAYDTGEKELQWILSKNSRTMLKNIVLEWSKAKMREKYWGEYDRGQRVRYLEGTDRMYIRGYEGGVYSGEERIEIPEMTPKIVREVLLWIELRTRMMSQMNSRVRVGQFVEEGHVSASTVHACRRQQEVLREMGWCFL